MSFGKYKGRNVYLMHTARNLETKEYMLPFICWLRNPIRDHYNEFLERKVKEGYRSLSLRLMIEGVDDKEWIRKPGSRRYVMPQGKIEEILEKFKKVVRFRLAMKRLRTRYRARLLHEEIVMKAWHPSRIERLLEMGYELDHILEL